MVWPMVAAAAASVIAPMVIGALSPKPKAHSPEMPANVGAAILRGQQQGGGVGGASGGGGGAFGGSNPGAQQLASQSSARRQQGSMIQSQAVADALRRPNYYG